MLQITISNNFGYDYRKCSNIKEVNLSLPSCYYYQCYQQSGKNTLVLRCFP